MPRKLTRDEFIIKAEAIHKNKYDYGEVLYINGDTDVSIRCKLHDYTFITTPQNHTYNKGGCPICRYKKSARTQTSTLDYFVKKAKSIYGDKFDYSLVEYASAKTKVIITCKAHNYTFQQTPDKHFLGNGCGFCVRNGYNKSKIGSFYILKAENLFKIGITNREVCLRKRSISKSSDKNFNIIYQLNFCNGEIARFIELILLKELRLKYKQPAKVFDGSTECFIIDDIGVILKRINTILTKEVKWHLTPQQTLEN